MPFAATQMDQEIIYYVKKVKEVYDITYMYNLKNDINELISKQKQTHRLRIHTYDSKGERLRGGLLRHLELTYTQYM